MKPIKQPFGTWSSNFTPNLLSSTIGLGEPLWDPQGEHLIWVEQRNGAGRLLVSDRSGDCPKEFTLGQNVRAHVGYGGGNFCVNNECVVFVGNNGNLYRQTLHSGDAVALTPGFGQCAFPQISPNGRWVAYIYELNGENGIAVVSMDGKRWPQKLITGADFYMDPRWSSDGMSLAWICWNHPNMPWDGTLLQIASLEDAGAPYCLQENIRTLAGGDSISVIQPEFCPTSNSLSYISDENGWYNLYLYDLDTHTTKHLNQDAAEYGGPAWVLGMRWYGWMPDGQSLVAIRSEQGFASLQSIDRETGQQRPLSVEGLDYTQLNTISISSQGELAVLASRPDTPTRLITAKLQQPISSVRILQRSNIEQLPTKEYSQPTPIQWNNEHEQTIYGLFYQPQNPRYRSDGLPPLIIQIHGGPTSQTLPIWKADAQYFTSRGYAYLDLNYRGSSGYGRTYRDLLKGQWGVFDVDDAISGAQYLVEQKQVDGRRLVIKGGSSGGYTVLQAMVNHPKFFCAGICSYGICDLFNLAKDTHKFEAHYTDSLIGPLPAAQSIYFERSPIFFAERIQNPLILFQGDEDKIVPPNQAEAIVKALSQHKVPHEYHLFKGEGHGWRRSETIVAYYQAINNFLERYVVFGRN